MTRVGQHRLTLGHPKSPTRGRVKLPHLMCLPCAALPVVTAEEEHSHADASRPWGRFVSIDKYLCPEDLFCVQKTCFVSRRHISSRRSSS
jgi:hypothetical protein